MRSLRSSGRRVRPRRAGFTLVEVMVVIIIIAVLLSLTAAAVYKVVGSQNVGNTKTTLNKLAVVLKANWNSVAEKAAREWDNNPAIRAKYLANVSVVAGNNPGLQRVVYIKARLVQVFPMTFNEVFPPSPPPSPPPPPPLGTPYLSTPAANPYSFVLPPLAVYQRKLIGLGISTGNTPPAAYESSALLLMALQEGISGQRFNPEDLGNAAMANFPPGSSQIQALVDGWGLPLAFIRWPTGSSDLNPGGPQAGTNHDTTDPQGYLTSTTWQSNASLVTNFQYATGGFATVGIGVGYTPPANIPPVGAQSFTLMPLLVSAGPDQLLGYKDYNATSDGTSAASDNLTTGQQ